MNGESAPNPAEFGRALTDERMSEKDRTLFTRWPVQGRTLKFN